MPYKSEKQRRYMHAKHPEIARKWDEKYGGKIAKARLMSDAEINRRKKVQGTVSRTTSTLGLTGVGIGTAALLASKKPGALKKVPYLRNKSEQQLKDAGLYTGLASGGIGGVGGYNFAAYTNAESRKRKPVRKDWSPVGRNYDPETRRERRSVAYETGSAVAGVGAAGAGLHQVGRAGKASRKAKGIKADIKLDQKVRATSGVSPYQKGQLTRGINVKTAEAAKYTAKAKKATTKGRVLAGASVAAAGTSVLVGHKRKSDSWQPYSKSNTVSAFGVDHGTD